MNIVFDIGTHEAQELKVLFGRKGYIWSQYFRWWFDWAKRQVKKVIKYDGLTRYGEGGFKRSPLSFNFLDHVKLLLWYSEVGIDESDLRVIAIDPVALISARHIKRISGDIMDLIYLPLAIIPEDSKGENSLSLTKFYIEKNSLSSSLQGSSTSLPMVCAGITFKNLLLSLLEQGLISKNDNFIFRLNCEGIELEIIKTFFDLGFESRLALGSVNDVRKKHGDVKAKELDEILQRENMNFCYFKGSDPSTWARGRQFFLNEVKKLDEIQH